LADANTSGLRVENDALAGTVQEVVAPAPAWSYNSYAYSGSCLWRKTGHKNPFLPVPAAVAATIRREWDGGWIDLIHGLHRLESGARPDLVLPAGDRRRMYIVMAWRVPETLVIAEDGALLLKSATFKYRDHLQ
jgi:hypothetical protein